MLRCWGGLQWHNFHTEFQENILFQKLKLEKHTHIPTHARTEHGDLTSLYVCTSEEGK
jgi:hypothetical protein